jgi:SNF2 family DNA or RNA helicase
MAVRDSRFPLASPKSFRHTLQSTQRNEPRVPMRLEDLKPGLALTGLEAAVIGSVVAVVPIGGSAVQVLYKTPDGTLKERLLNRTDESTIALATAERPWSFDGDGDAFKLTVEAKRIDLAFLFDPMMAIHTSNVDPLPHQITAVYESMLPRQPLRFVLADDPGAGKTVMAGLYIRELIMRADARRIVIISPGSLVEQWRDEMFEKFGLEFRVFTKDLEAASPNGNPFESVDHLIVRLDQLARDEEEHETEGKKPGPLQSKLLNAGWDLVVFDEAHKLAAHFFGSKLEKTGRFRFAERIGRHTRHLLLMTATPHNGKEEDFQLFLSLLDSDRFYGKFRDGVHKVDTTDLMRRMVKEELVKFDGTPLFPERKAYTVNYKLADIEVALYEAVTQYVTTEMGKADELQGARKGSVGFALTSLQRRLASSPEAIFQSLKRRRERLQHRLREEKIGHRGSQILAETVGPPSPPSKSPAAGSSLDAQLPTIPEDDDDLNADEQERLEESLVDRATAARTIAELEDEIDILIGLEKQAKDVVASGQDRKWDELSRILQHDAQIQDAGGRLRKIIIFSEHRDTLNYLHAKIAGVLGNHDAIVTIHGGTHRDDRLKAQALFRSDPEIRVLVATDAAGEGVNLQCANLMVNYDLPWNPNRLEQRFGRIHRIGQQEVCHLWNLVAKETREGDVYYRLLEKLRVESDALKGRVFDILGEVFEERSLKDLLIEAIRYGDRPEIRSKLRQRIDHNFDHDNLRTLLDRNALAQESFSPERLFSVKEEMEKAEARRLQPYFVRSFFMKAFEALGGSIYGRESDRFEISHVPAVLRERDRLITGRNRRDTAPVLKRYERVCFTKEAVRPLDKPGLPFANMIHPGHPLMLALSDVLLEQHANLLRQGAILVDPADEGEEPSLLFLLTHEIRSGDGLVISKRLQFVRVLPDSTATFAGWAPHLDLEPLPAAERETVLKAVASAAFSTLGKGAGGEVSVSQSSSNWLNAGLEQRALALAATTLVPEHYNEIAGRRIAHVDKTLAAVHERLTREIDFWSDRFIKLSDDQKAGKDVRLNLENVRRTLTDLESRLESRKKELQSMRHVTSATPVVLSGSLVVPAGLLRKVRGEPPPDAASATFAIDPAARSRIEQLAMNAVRKAEEARGCRVVDVSAQKCGWDLTSHPPALDGKQSEPRHIEVKGRVKGASTVTVTRNEILYALNQAEKFIMAIVLVGENEVVESPIYLRNPFDAEPGWGVSSVNYDLGALIERAEKA